MNALSRGPLLVAALLAPLACSSDDKAPALGGGGSAGSDMSPSRSGRPPAEYGGESSGGSDGGEPAGAPAGGVGDRPIIGEIGGEGIELGQAGAPPNPTPLCALDATWQTTALEGVNTEADERLLALTPDERTLVFARGQELFVLDDGRVSPLTLPAGYAADLGVSLAPDGLSLLIVQEEGIGFAEVSRSARTGPFDSAPSVERLRGLNDVLVTSGGRFWFPALSADGAALYFTLRMGNTVANVWRATGEGFRERDLQDRVTLGTEDGEAKLVVGVAADDRTLFVFDEALGYVTAMSRVTPAAEFREGRAFEDFETMIPSAACDRIYATTEIAGSLDIVVATPK